MPQPDRLWWAGGSFEGRPIRNVLAAHDVGAIFRFLKTRGWSRAAIAAATGLTETRVRAVSQGKQYITSYEVLERIAEGLHIERGLMGLAHRSSPAPARVADQSRGPAPVPSLPPPHVAPVIAALAEIRSALDTADLPPDGPLRPLPELATAVAAALRTRLTSNYRHLSAILPDLLHDLHRAGTVWAGQHRAAVAALLTQAYRAADALADKSGHHDLSARIIDAMANAAGQSGSDLVTATAAYVRGELFFTNGRHDLGRAALERAADRLTPGTDPATSAAYGCLHMRAAILAGRAGQLQHAQDHLAEAARYAALVPEGEYNGTAFGPSSVRIHQVTLAVDTDDPDSAVRAAHGWDPPNDLPGERRSHLYIDLARAYHRLGAVDDAVIALYQARAVAPEHTRLHPRVRALLTELLSQGTTTGRIGEYARWAAVPAAVSQQVA